MAANKKSFLLYCDIIHTVKKLSNDQAGELFKTILSYVNDENPNPENQIIDLVFEPIKQQLKRDLKNYETRCKRNKENGLKGGRPKSETNQIEPKKPTGLIGNPSKAKKADNDKDIDIDTDNDKDIDIIKTPEEIVIDSQKPFRFSQQSVRDFFKSEYEGNITDPDALGFADIGTYITKNGAGGVFLDNIRRFKHLITFQEYKYLLSHYKFDNKYIKNVILQCEETPKYIRESLNNTIIRWSNNNYNK
jgi:hypothetical protein